jgi:hypothetical protein
VISSAGVLTSKKCNILRSQQLPAYWSDFVADKPIKELIDPNWRQCKAHGTCRKNNFAKCGSAGIYLRSNCQISSFVTSTSLVFKVEVRLKILGHIFICCEILIIYIIYLLLSVKPCSFSILDIILCYH